MTRREAVSAPPDSAAGPSESERWFSAYVEPPSQEEAFESSVRAPRRRRRASWAGILVAAPAVLAVSGATLYLYARVHPGVLPSWQASRVRSDASNRGASVSSAAAGSVTRSSAIPAPSVSLPVPIAPPTASADGSSLPSGEGYLAVTSSASASVYVNGRLYGPANEPLRVPCGVRLVRLGEPPGPHWVSAGHTVSVACRGFTACEIQPDTARDTR